MAWEGIEKRKFVRANYPCKISVSPPHGHVIFTHTENISAGGLRVIIDERLDISSLVGLEVYLQEAPIVCKGRIVWVVEKMSLYEKGFVFFDTGIEFYEIKEGDREIIKEFVGRIIVEKNDSRKS